MVALAVESSQQSRSIKNKCKMFHVRYNILNLQNKLFITKVGCAIIASTQQLRNVQEMGKQTAETNRKMPDSYSCKSDRKNNICLTNIIQRGGQRDCQFILFSPLCNLSTARIQGLENLAESQIWYICSCYASIFLCK